ncbi:MAG TPA: tRNA (adenosine(37)-N6)-threonylcarbamoyltransferase complex ATPase subunit type 1 TsaE [Acidimicrobiales bacterium]|nr:tRNA (adenosine(37)-N6)-threonylcarbamoyltransferase complex ATPase subunit type 1 TsaE [Acidimicrobiales bacterium]
MTPAPIVARTTSPGDTRRLAAALAGELTAGDLLLLVGDLGTGKTTFTQGLARGLGVTDPVTSPTFTLVRAYPCAAGSVSTLLHADLYRLDRLSDVVDLGLAEMVEDDAVAVVEWGDVAASVFGPDVLTVRLAAPPTGDARPADGPVGERPDEDRIVTIHAAGTWSARRAAVAARLAPWTSAGHGRRRSPPESR